MLEQYEKLIYREQEYAELYARTDEPYRFMNKKTNAKIILSSPHSTKHIRNGTFKHSEPFVTVMMEDILDFLSVEPIIGIYKSGDISTDPNYSTNCDYKNALIDYIKANESVEYFLDFHIMSSSRPTDLQLGTNGMKNINGDSELLHNITDTFERYEYSYLVDDIFSASKENGLNVYIKNHGDSKIKSLLFEFNFRNFKDYDSYQKIRSMVMSIILDLLNK